jgi:hypothetical protein
MYTGSSFIELGTLRLIFRYPIKQLWKPVFIGNAITYFLTLFKFKADILAILGG